VAEEGDLVPRYAVKIPQTVPEPEGTLADPAMLQPEIKVLPPPLPPSDTLDALQ